MKYKMLYHKGGITLLTTDAGFYYIECADNAIQSVLRTIHPGEVPDFVLLSDSVILRLTAILAKEGYLNGC